MKFAEFNLLVDEQEISNLDLFVRDKRNNEYENFEYEDVQYVIQTKIIQNNIFWLYVRYGKEKPYSKEVLNVSTKTFKQNPKHQKEIELKDQMFGAYVLSEHILYLSNYKKHSFLCAYLSKTYGKKFLIKNYYIDPTSFATEITSIKEIRFVAKRNVFNGGSIFKEIEDSMGYGSMDTLEVKARITKNTSFVKSKFLNLVDNLLKRKENKEIDKMQCIGKDDSGVEKIFNLETILKKIELKINKKEDGMYDAELVEKNFLEKIGELEDVE